MLRLFLACHDLEVDRWYEEGTSWSGDSDPCVHCECQVGQGQGRWADSNPCAQIATRSKKGGWEGPLCLLLFDRTFKYQQCCGGGVGGTSGQCAK